MLGVKFVDLTPCRLFSAKGPATKMGVVNSLYRGIGKGKQPIAEGEPTLHRATAEALIEAQLALVFLSAAEVLTHDFSFDAEQLTKFQELWFTQIEILRLKKK